MSNVLSFAELCQSTETAQGALSENGRFVRMTWNAHSQVVHQLGYDYPVLGGLNDGWKTRKAGRYRAEASAG